MIEAPAVVIGISPTSTKGWVHLRLPTLWPLRGLTFPREDFPPDLCRGAELTFRVDPDTFHAGGYDGAHYRAVLEVISVDRNPSLPGKTEG